MCDPAARGHAPGIAFAGVTMIDIHRQDSLAANGDQIASRDGSYGKSSRPNAPPSSTSANLLVRLSALRKTGGVVVDLPSFISQGLLYRVVETRYRGGRSWYPTSCIETAASWRYLAGVSLDRTQMQIEDKLVNLTPGMAVTAEIKPGQRRVIEYLLSPLLRYKQESLRER